MLRWALLFAIVALLAGFFGFFHLEATAAMLAKLFAFVFLILFVVSLLMGGRGAHPPV